MDEKHREKFEKAYNKCRSIWNRLDRMAFHQTWEACLEANGIGKEKDIPEGYYRIGEEVEYRSVKQDPGNLEQFQIGTIAVAAHMGTIALAIRADLEVRRKPAWAPKEGEAVLIPVTLAYPRGVNKKSGTFAMAAIWSDGGIVFLEGRNSHYDGDMIPYDASKIGKPWSEI